MSRSPQHTLWLWVEGMFPRRLDYFLLSKGLVASPAELLAGKTTTPDLRIVLMEPNMSGSGPPWIFNPAEDTLTPGTSTPCLRIACPSTGTEKWVHESTAILCYLEDVYASSGPETQPKAAMDRARMNDRLVAINEGFIHGVVYMKHAIPGTDFWSGLKDEDRSLAAARNSLQSMVTVFSKVQAWSEDSLESTGWLTPGIDGPGLVDFSLAALCRYTELCYGWDILEDEKLRQLAEWYRRFRTLPWWGGFEERQDVKPKNLAKEASKVGNR